MSNIIKEKSYFFSLKIIRLYRHLASQREFVISRQLLRSGTSIGANVEEALAGQSRRDFHMKMTIAFKEARETHYWLRLLQDSKIVNEDYSDYLKDADEIVRLLNTITRKTKPSRVLTKSGNS